MSGMRKRFGQRLGGAGFLACAVTVFGATAVASAAPLYGHNQVGTFGTPYTWGGLGAETINSTDDGFDARFTALEPLTIGGLWQEYRSVEFAGNAITIELRDDTAGAPGSTVLASVSTTAPLTTTFPTVMQHNMFNTSVMLNPGDVYHVVTRVTTFDPSEPGGIQVTRSTNDNGIRPYDRQADTLFSSLTQIDGGAWAASALDPRIVFTTGVSTAILAGPGNPYSSGQTANSFVTRGVSSSSAPIGQLFTIFDSETPAGATVWVDSVNLFVSGGTRNFALAIQLRDLAGNILGQGTIAAGAPTGTISVALDQTVILAQGTKYLLTTEALAGVHTDTWFFNGMRTSSGAPYTTFGPETWGGDSTSAALAYAIDRVGSSWTGFTANANNHIDLMFTFNGTVYTPEPASAVLLLAGGAMVMRRRGRRLD